MKKWLSIFIFTLLSTSPLWAQDLFSAQTNTRQVQVGESFRVKFIMKKRGSDFQPPDFSGFKQLSGRNVSMSTTMDASGTHFTLTYSYILKGKKPGAFTIGPAFATIEGETYRTKPLKITVKPRQSSPSSNEQPGKPERLLLKPLVSARQVYVGEPLYARYRLYFKDQIGQPQISEEPRFDGFYRRAIKQDRIRTKSERYQGQRYTAGDLRQMVLIPQRPGRLEPGTLQLEVPVNEATGQRDWFGRPITRTRQRTLRKTFPPIQVKALPPNKKPASFSGGVGEFSFEARLSRQELTTDESLTLTLEVKGQGNIALLELPQPEFPEAFEVFDPETDQQVKVGSFGMRGSQSAEYLLVPRYSGTYKLGPIRFSYFDPQAERYRTISSPQFTIDIKGGQVPTTPPGSSAAAPPSGTTGEQQQVNYLNRTLRFIQTKTADWQPQNRSLLRTPGYWIAYGSLWLVALFMVILYLIQRQKRHPDKQNQRRQRLAARRSQKHLAQARKKLRAGAHEAFYTELAQALWGYFSQKFDIPLSQFTKDRLREELRRAGLPAEDTEDTLQQLESAEMARYTGLAQKNPEQDFERSRLLLTKIERRL